MEKESIVDSETVICFVAGITAILSLSLLVLL
jgi:hypothetical protein